jgi:hypothetical protein
MSSYISSHAKQLLSTLRTTLLGCREDVVGLEGVGWAVGAKDLPALALPLWPIDRIDPVLDFHDDAAVLLHKLSTAFYTLSRLEWNGACITISPVHHVRRETTYRLGQGSCTSGKPPGPSRCRS